jgi:lipid A ethanolaminephosphotransferase
MEREISSTERDILIVLHTMGSHGPAYYRRYPAEFEVFKPCCKESSPQKSPQQEVVNAYDNTILYTDYVLDRLIAALEARQKSENAFLFYVSDHGESLGENGVYLHGLPDLLAPSAQTHIPMLAWLSPSLVADHSLDYPRLRQRSSAPYSHDNVAQTMLGLFEVKTALYIRDLDLFTPRSQ